MGELDIRNLSKTENAHKKEEILKLFEELKKSYKFYNQTYMKSKKFDNITNIEYDDDIVKLCYIVDDENVNNEKILCTILRPSDFEEKNILKEFIDCIKSVNQSGGKNSKDYYIDKDNKKYNRKITKNDKKQFVRYNNKIIELKMYKELIKKEKKAVKDKQKHVKKTSMKKK